MPPTNLAKKLKPARKAWKSFTNKIKTKLENFHIPESIKMVSCRFIEFCSIHVLAPFKKRFLSKYSSNRPRRYNYNHLYHYQHNPSQLKNRKPIYIDHLYAEPPMSMQTERVEAGKSRRNEATGLKRKGKEKEDEEEEEEESGIYSIDDAWKAIVAKSPHLRVDERADEFIYKFHEDRKLEKERSEMEFQEMLARSS